ncbi:MAG: ABC transporter ATP-binding protein [Methanotrichaceae archaeon]|nr:ABC transporter ATP-binding protein [Methanotrichaceae archaeon]
MDVPAIEAQGLCKSYKSFRRPRSVVLKDISLKIEPGEIFGLLGPNGSGKTTLISIFSTLIYPDRGRLKVLGLDSRKSRDAIRKVINISTAKPNFPWSLTVRENLRHYAMLYGMYGPELSRAVADVMDAFALEEYRDVTFEDLSTGLKQRLALAKAMLNRPKLLFLDEPTTGLDPEMANKTRQLVRSIHEDGISVVLSTHYMPEAEVLCDRIAFLRKGVVVALDTPQNLKGHLRLGERVVIVYEGPADLSRLKEDPGIMSVKSEPGRAEFVVDKSSESLDRIVKQFSKARIKDIAVKEPDLEDVFLELAR